MMNSIFLEGNTSSEKLLANIDKMSAIFKALPDPVFILSKSGKYVAVLGGNDSRYYHDASELIGLYLSEVMKTNKYELFLNKINEALSSAELLIFEYELSIDDFKENDSVGSSSPFWFEARIQKLDFLIDNEEVVLWVASNMSERHNLEIQLRKLSYKDQLTNLFNRRKFEKDLTYQLELYARYGTQTSILIFDIDNLKSINDNYGHHVGDDAITNIADKCLSQIRCVDSAYRLGGDEFIIIMPNTQLQDASYFAERLRKTLKLSLSKFTTEALSFSVSIGVSCFLSGDDSYKKPLQRADNALYRAKRTGKNKVEILKNES